LRKKKTDLVLLGHALPCKQLAGPPRALRARRRDGMLRLDRHAQIDICNRREIAYGRRQPEAGMQARPRSE